MWSDVVLFAPLMAFIIDTHVSVWKWADIIGAVATGLVISTVMHLFVYVPAGRNTPEAHTHHGRLTLAGKIHLVYMAIGIAVLALYYLATPGLSLAEVHVVSGLLFLHFVIGTHVPFKVWVRMRKPDWYPDGPVIDGPTAATLGGLAVALVLISQWATR